MNNSIDRPTRLSIADWSVQDRPREKFITHGAAHLSDAELLAILLRTGSATENAVELAKRVLRSCDNKLNSLAELTLEELSTIKGIGNVKAVSLLAAFELGKRLRAETIEEQQCIFTTVDVIELMQDKIATLKHEEFWAIYLNSASKILGIQQISKGGLTSVAVDFRILLQEAILKSASAIIVCHNHPSGSVAPSQLDKQITTQLHQAVSTLGIKLLDHLIIHKDSYYSFAENNVL